MTGRPKIVVLGMMTKMPVAGIVWLTVPYLVGLRRLGYDVYYVEAHARTPSMLMKSPNDDASALAAAFLGASLRRFGFDGRWAYHALHDSGDVYGMTPRELQETYRSAALIVNLHGGTEPLPEHTQNDNLVLVETDPVELEIELHDGDERARTFLDAHCAVFTWGQNFGRPDCKVPLPDGVVFRPTRMPVLLDEWTHDRPPRDALTTIGNWEQAWRDVTFGGEVYHWSKHYEFLKFLDVPQRTTQRFELALASCPPDARALLERHGWHVRAADELSGDVDVYRDFVTSSRGEFTVAKDQNVRLRTGWFSDRSAAYLAAGRPVITQDTGFGNTLPTGEGLFAFSTADDVVAAVDDVNSAYDRHAHAAREIAREYFDASSVLRHMLTELGLPAFPPSLSLAVASRAPTTLAEETREAVLAAALPPKAPPASGQTPELSVVVPAVDGLPFTRLCLESVLADPTPMPLELIVVDNASSDGTRAYLDELGRRDPRLRVILNGRNEGFAAAVNAGLALARGRVLVLLNNDALPAPGTLTSLARALDDEGVGLVGPVSNRASSEAEIDVRYSTLSGFYEAAREREAAKGDALLEVPMLTLFCAALRRDVLDTVGALDERFGRGLFEDDDYSRRIRAAGYRVVCADGVLVHHFGEASLGALQARGEYAPLFEANRKLFEQKWGEQWQRTTRRRTSDEYRDLVDRVRAAVLEEVPHGASVLVVSKGDNELLRVAGRRVSHFPQDDRGVYAGFYPADGSAAVDHLDRLAADFLVVPATGRWWLDHYDELRRRLDGRCVRDDDACAIFALRSGE